MTTVIRELPLGQVHRNEQQPREDFPAEHIASLAKSIKARGLLQPITVREVGPERFEIVAGECRWRASEQAGCTTIRAIVAEGSDSERDILAIIENVTRKDMNLIEEGRAYQRMLDKGWTIEDLATSTGKSASSIEQRLQLLAMRPQYQDLTRTGAISPYVAGFLAKLTPDRQDRLFRAVKEGRCEGWVKQKSAFDALFDEQQQGSMFGDAESGKVTEADEQTIKGLERRVEAIAAMVAGGFNKDGGVDVAKKVAPHRCRDMADKLDLIQVAITHLTKELRRSAAQLDLVA
jgi:ParB family transcriptional regulator, chromosome partitioning protein